MTKDLEQLRHVTRILKEQAMRRYRQALQERAALDSELAEIDEMRKLGQRENASLHARQSIGADTLWNGWMLQRRLEILQKTALCRAKEEDRRDAAKRAFSRDLALQEIIQDAKTEREKGEAQKEAVRTDALVLMQRSLFRD